MKETQRPTGPGSAVQRFTPHRVRDTVIVAAGILMTRATQYVSTW